MGEIPDRPSDGWSFDELREEFDWMVEFYGRLAEKIRGDKDVHNLADYVRKLEAENAKLRELMGKAMKCAANDYCTFCRFVTGGCELRTSLRELGIEVGDDD